MKTTHQSTRSFPETSRFIVYVFAVAIFCLFNWMALQAQSQSKKPDILLAALQSEEVEPEIEVATWMLDFSYGFSTAGEEIEVEAWMLDFSYDLTADMEPEITLEPWMLTYSEDIIADKDPEIVLEPWMLTFSDDCLGGTEPGLSVENWMINRFLWDSACMLARK
jgi:hypothetical protein